MKEAVKVYDKAGLREHFPFLPWMKKDFRSLLQLQQKRLLPGQMIFMNSVGNIRD